MKKLFIALPFLAGAAAIASTSQYAGTQTKNEYHQLLAQLNDLSPLVFVNEQYDAGLAHSSAITKVMATRTADAEILFRLQHDIQHAPVRMDDEGVSVGTVRINTRLHEEAFESPDILALFTDATPFTLTTDVKYDGQISNQLRISAFVLSEKGESVDWSGLHFDGVTQDGATVGNGSMGDVTFSNEDTGVVASIETSQFDIDVQHHGDNVYTGTGDVKLSNISVFSSDMPLPVSLASIEVSSSTDMYGSVLSNKTRFSMNGIDSPIPVSNASLSMRVDGVMIEGMRQYKNMLNANHESLLVGAEMGERLASALRVMFVPGSAIKYAIALDNSDGNVHADLRVGVKGDSADGMSADALNNVTTGRDLLNVLTINGSLYADTAALVQTPAMMILGGAGDFITVTDESVTSEVRLEGTTLIVNGVELPLGVMSGNLLDRPFAGVI